MEFGSKVLGFKEDELQSTPAFRCYEDMSPAEENLLVKSRVLAYSTATLNRYIAVFKKFQKFCRARDINSLDCTPSTFNIYLLTVAQSGSSVGCIETIVLAMNFLYRFFLIGATIVDISVSAVLKFLEKTCPRNVHLRWGFGSVEVRKMWDTLEKRYNGIENLPLAQLHTFVMAVIQHASLCRFSDIAQLKLPDLFYDLDYLKIHIQLSKTNQNGIGQVAFIPKLSSSVRDPHSLMCLYLLVMHEKQNESVFLFPPLK